MKTSFGSLNIALNYNNKEVVQESVWLKRDDSGKIFVNGVDIYRNNTIKKISKEPKGYYKQDEKFINNIRENIIKVLKKQKLSPTSGMREMGIFHKKSPEYKIAQECKNCFNENRDKLINIVKNDPEPVLGTHVALGQKRIKYISFNKK